MDVIMSATSILGLSQEVLRVWIDEDVAQVLQQLTQLFIIRWAAQLHDDDALGRPRTPCLLAGRVTVQEAIIHLHLAATIAAGGELSDYKSVRDSLVLMLPNLPIQHRPDMTAKLVNALVKMLKSPSTSDDDTWPFDSKEIVHGIVRLRRFRGQRDRARAAGRARL
jgi:hypothetical protein